MEKPIISITTCSRRPQYYQNYINSIKNTSVPFEIIFVGPNPPTEKMPDNFTYILSNATPCQCIEIAVRNARGKYVTSIYDDHIFSEHFLDKLYEYTQRLDMDRVLISLRYWLDIRSQSLLRFADDGLVFDSGVVASPVIGVSSLFRRDIWLKLGGLDRRFHSAFCDIDLQMRFYEYGMNPFIPPDCFITEIEKRNGPFKEKGWKHPTHPNCSLLIKHGTAGRQLLNDFWKKDTNTISRTRLLPVEGFAEEEIPIKGEGRPYV